MQPDTISALDQIVRSLVAPGPLGVFFILILIGYLLDRKKLRLGREVEYLETQVIPKLEADVTFWRDFSLRQLHQTDKVVEATSALAKSTANGGGAP